MNRETFSLSQKELQRVAVISACIKGEMACARAAELLCLSVRQIKRLKKRLREDGEAALAHASRGRPSPRRLPVRMRDRILHLARTRYVGFNDHHLCEKVRVAEFFPTEDARGYFHLLRHLLRRYGVPLSFYGDKHGVFVRNDDHWTVEEQLAGKRQPTQFGRALAQLGVTYIPANSPQAKGRIERLWGTFQDRLTSELRLVGAADLVTANDVLRRFLPDYNRRFGRAPRETEKAWRTAPKDLSRICCFVHERIVSNDNVVQWDGRRFQIPPQPKRFSFAAAKVQLCESLRGSITTYYGDSKLHHAD